MTLAEIPVSGKGKIISVKGHGALRRRLLDMGLTPGTVVLVRKLAPMGDPMELFLRNYALSLRREDAGNIIVECIE
ncbi:MAG: FeoA family protein [Christensenellales bacterium]|jgi:ferrous iron transport protein A